MTWPVTVASATAGTVGTAADFNNHRDALNTAGGAWTAYTPTWTASTTNPTIGSSTVSGRYRLVGHTIDVRISITIGAGFSAGSGSYSFRLPSGIAATVVNTSEVMGMATVFDTSASSTFIYTAYLFSSIDVRLRDNSGVVTHASPMAWATGDKISILLPSLEVN